MVIAHNLWKYTLTSKMRAEIGLKKHNEKKKINKKKNKKKHNVCNVNSVTE